jgi:hypothetical protein
MKLSHPSLENGTGLGTCCGCETDRDVHNVLMLDQKGVTPGKGWGCYVCGLEPDGAVVVLCDACMGQYQQGNAAIVRFACAGSPGKDGRVPVSALPQGYFGHDMSRHPELRGKLQ